MTQTYSLAGVLFRFTHNDGEHSSSNGSYALTYQLNYGGNHGTTPGNWGEWKTLEQNTCLRNGKKVHSRELICSHCKKTVRTELKEEMIPAHGHSFPSGAWNYETCPSSGISQARFPHISLCILSWEYPHIAALQRQGQYSPAVHVHITAGKKGGEKVINTLMKSIIVQWTARGTTQGTIRSTKAFFSLFFRIILSIFLVYFPCPRCKSSLAV